MEPKRKMINEALRGKPPEIPEPKFVIIRVRGQSDEEVERITRPKIEKAKKEYYENFNPYDTMPIIITAFDTPFD